MFKNYFKIAWRNISKYKFHSFINVGGLAIGIAFAFLIGAYVWNALRVNASLKNENDQYIIQTKYGTDPTFYLTTFGNLAKALKEQYPGLVANYYRWDGITSTVSKGDKHFREGIQINDSTLFSMYGFPVLHGNIKTAFNDPYSAVITEETAKKYFGRTNVVGQTFTIDNFSGGQHGFMITAVLKSMPENSISKINDDNINGVFLSPGSINFFNRQQMDSWNNASIVSYIQLQKGVTPKQLEEPIRHLIHQNTSVDLKQTHTVIVSLNDYYLQANNNLVEKMLYTLSCIAAFILLMAIINFINISISKASSRMKEIGVRKVLGGMRKQLILQFLTESVLLVFFSTMVALIIYVFMRPYLSNVLGKNIPTFFSFPVYIYFIPILLTLIIGLLAGIYPATVLSSLKSAEVIKGKLTSIKENILLRKSLVAFQFCIAAIVLIGSIVISKQVNYLFGKDLGYDKEYLISAQVPRDWSAQGVAHMETIRNEIASMPQVSNAAVSWEIPNGNNGSSAAYKLGQDSTQAIYTELYTTDENYASTYKVPMAAGNFFNTNEANDSSKIVINETFAKAFGWRDAHDAINQQIKLQGFGNTLFTISGVVKDFHLWSMQGTIPVMCFVNVKLNPFYRYLTIRLKPGNIPDEINALQKKWSALMPGAPFEYRFMDETLQKIYSTELQLKQAAYTSTVLSLIIVLLGVLGLISLSIQKRTKEIGIRKVLGSSVSGIISLFMKEFLWIIVIAAIVACPLAYMIMHGWLQGYAYRINVTATPFIISIICLGLITALLICIQTIKAAIANPVKSLRTE
ncbi:ABC transporter permease [Parafilimonas sp.]|uniref:ABC transporter permease n=1 Tax=Parafilimonas sp. TaxID=1969739 RepID=UPI003F801867